MSELSKIELEMENTPANLLEEVKKYFDESEDEISISRIQRAFSIGYFRAGRIIRQIEKGW